MSDDPNSKNPGNTSSGSSRWGQSSTSSSSTNNKRGYSSYETTGVNYEDMAQQLIAVANLKVESAINERMVAVDQAERRTRQALKDSEEMLKKSQDMLESLTNMMTSIQSSLKASAELSDKSSETQRKLEEEVSSVKGNAVAALSVFVSFFAFITVTINVFSKAESVISASVLVLLFWCMLIGFNFLITIQFKAVRQPWAPWLGIVLVILVSLVSIWGLYIFGPEIIATKALRKFFI